MKATTFCPCEDKGGCHCWQKGYEVAQKYAGHDETRLVELERACAEVAASLDVLTSRNRLDSALEMVLLKLASQLRSTSATACNVEVYSSRMCERGTKSCTVEHDRSQADG
jgi:hypothetical protein